MCSTLNLLQLFERRDKVVKQKEVKHWKHATADMMSRRVATVLFVVDQRIVEKTDCRFAMNGEKTLAKRREYGEECVIKLTPKDILDRTKEANGAMESTTANGAMPDDISGGSEDELSE